MPNCYTLVEKQRAYRRAAKALRALAAELGISPKGYDIRHCYGGPGVSGEAIFHSDTLYINLPLFPFSENTRVHKGYFRSCQGRKDYTGGRNIWFEGNPAPCAEEIRRAVPQAVPAP
jgi:hypothetical protein